MEECIVYTSNLVRQNVANNWKTRSNASTARLVFLFTSIYLRTPPSRAWSSFIFVKNIFSFNSLEIYFTKFYVFVYEVLFLFCLRSFVFILFMKFCFYFFYEVLFLFCLRSFVFILFTKFCFYFVYEVFVFILFTKFCFYFVYGFFFSFHA